MNHAAQLLRVLALVSLFAFPLHGVWEYLHVGLYSGYEQWTHGTPVVLLATIGDVLYTYAAFGLVSALKRRVDWIYTIRGSEYLLLAGLGFVMALCIEYRGVVLSRWSYLPAMPIIPILGVGLSPVLEMTVLLPVTFFIVSRLLKV